jgi:hypothetical protein
MVEFDIHLFECLGWGKGGQIVRHGESPQERSVRDNGQICALAPAEYAETIFIHNDFLGLL